MKQVMLILTSYLAVSLYSSAGAEQKNDLDIVNNTATSLEFVVDPKLETFYIVGLLAEYPLITRFPNTYKNEALEYFDKYRNHKAVGLMKAMADKGLVADYAVNWLYQHTDFPAFQKKQSINFRFDARPLSMDSLELLRKELINFYKVTSCNNSLKTRSPF